MIASVEISAVVVSATSPPSMLWPLSSVCFIYKYWFQHRSPPHRNPQRAVNTIRCAKAWRPWTLSLDPRRSIVDPMNHAPACFRNHTYLSNKHESLANPWCKHRFSQTARSIPDFASMWHLENRMGTQILLPNARFCVRVYMRKRPRPCQKQKP